MITKEIDLKQDKLLFITDDKTIEVEAKHFRRLIKFLELKDSSDFRLQFKNKALIVVGNTDMVEITLSDGQLLVLTTGLFFNMLESLPQDDKSIKPDPNCITCGSSDWKPKPLDKLA